MSQNETPGKALERRTACSPSTPVEDLPSLDGVERGQRKHPDVLWRRLGLP